MKLAVNVDHVATLRQARGVAYPDPVEAARIAEQAGAAGITVHLRGDRRHIQEADVERLRSSVTTKLNLELAATAEMVAIALRHRPDQVSLVPERPEEVTTEGGLDLGRHRGRVEEVAARMAETGIAVSLFLDPDPRQVEAAAELPRELVAGFEINTDAYTRAAAAVVAGKGRRQQAADRTAAEHTLAEELAQVRRAARLGAGAGLQVYAGHGLTTANVGPIAAIPEIEELNIGHALVSRAVLVGLAEAVREMLRAMGESQPGEGVRRTRSRNASFSIP
jgi:pyridoxine 5-phosphate synthase